MLTRRPLDRSWLAGVVRTAGDRQYLAPLHVLVATDWVSTSELGAICAGALSSGDM